jgi:predicted DNA-binding transcriptional regulator AlpA
MANIDTAATDNAERKVVRGWRGAERKTKKGRVQLWRDVRDKRFPAPFELGPNSIGWYEDEIDEWLAARPRRTYSSTSEAA